MGGGKRAISKAVSEMKRLSTPVAYIYNWAYRIAGALSGLGSVYPLCVINDSADLAIMHRMVANRLGYTSQAIINKFAVGGFTGEYTLQSLANYNQEVYVYKCVPRRELSNTQAPIVNYSTVTPLVPFADARKALFDGYAEQTGGGVVAQDSWPIGLTPFDINKFCCLWKVVGKVRKFKLRGGAEFVVTIKDKRWRMWNGTDIYQASPVSVDTSSTCFPRATRFYLMIVNGGLINDSTNKTLESTAATTIAILGKERYHCTGIANAAATLTPPVSSFGTITGAGNVIVERTGVAIAPTSV